MKRYRITLLALALACLAVSSGKPPCAYAETRLPSKVQRSNPNAWLSSHGSATAAPVTTSIDSFYIYGGPGTTEGKFELADGQTPDRQGWVGVDHTDFPVYWQISTFNAENLGSHGAGNLAAWCGQDASQQPDWAVAPGYGNSWDSTLLFESPPLINTGVAQTVNLNFVLNYDVQPGYDYVLVEYDSAGTWLPVMQEFGTNHDGSGVFAAPGAQFSNLEMRSIEYAGNDYSGPDGNRIRIRIRVLTDGGWSDQDGLFPSSGAAQVDDISVSWSEGGDVETFESGAFDGLWHPVHPAFFGDFSKVWPLLSDGDLDACAENTTPIMAFVDGGQEVGNAASAVYNPGYPTSTGGSLSTLWHYGVPGNWVLNREGGLSSSSLSLHNSVVSPEIVWDLPGSADDGFDMKGAELRFSMWEHGGFTSGVFYNWAVRTSQAGSRRSWTPWRSRGAAFLISNAPQWSNLAFDFSDLLVPSTAWVQVRLGVVDLGDIFGFPGATTPAPAFDNVAVVKYRVTGPSITAREVHLASDGFPANGSIDASTQAARDALDIPFDMARDIGSPTDGSFDPGDSIVVDVQSLIPGVGVNDIRMFWRLDKNPLFEDAIRTAPAGPMDLNVVTGLTTWSGQVLNHYVFDPNAGQTIPNRYYFDLPDADFLYPGDVLRYYIRATDSDGRVSTLPSDTSGFITGDAYDRRFTVRGLPSLYNAFGAQAPKLIVQDAGHGQEEVTLLNSMSQLGFVEGVDYDVFTRREPSTGVSPGLASSGGHGANVSQLSGYDSIVYLSGQRSVFLLSDGSAMGNNDESDDLGLLTAWHQLPGARSMAHLGSKFVSGLDAGSTAGKTYISSVLGVRLNDADVLDEIQAQSTPVVQPSNGNFSTSFAIAGGCPNLHAFDSLDALAGSSVGHVYLDPAGAPIAGPAASVLRDRVVGADRKVDITFPYALADMYTMRHKGPASTTAATELLREVFGYFGVSSSGGAVAAPVAQHFTLAVAPNPFNPRTVIRLAGFGEGDHGIVKIYDLRGALVATLADGTLDQGQFIWEGVDDKGRAVSSGVYLVDARNGDQRQTRKVALVR